MHVIQKGCQYRFYKKTVFFALSVCKREIIQTSFQNKFTINTQIGKQSYHSESAMDLFSSADHAKLYSKYSKEIYVSAKQGGYEIDGNPALRRLIDKAI